MGGTFVGLTCICHVRHLQVTGECPDVKRSIRHALDKRPGALAPARAIHKSRDDVGGLGGCGVVQPTLVVRAILGMGSWRTGRAGMRGEGDGEQRGGGIKAAGRQAGRLNVISSCDKTLMSYTSLPSKTYLLSSVFPFSITFFIFLFLHARTYKDGERKEGRSTIEMRRTKANVIY